MFHRFDLGSALKHRNGLVEIVIGLGIPPQVQVGREVAESPGWYKKRLLEMSILLV